MIKVMIRWRTWIVNVLAAIVLVLPEILQALSGFNWGTLIPPQYLPYVTLAIVVLNIWMRPRPAVIASDPEAERKSKARDDANPWDFQR